MASVGLCTVTTSKRGYPLEDATHIALSESHTHQLTAPACPVNLCVYVCVRDGAQVPGEAWDQHRGRGVRSVRARGGSSQRHLL